MIFICIRALRRFQVIFLLLSLSYRVFGSSATPHVPVDLVDSLELPASEGLGQTANSSFETMVTSTSLAATSFDTCQQLPAESPRSSGSLASPKQIECSIREQLGYGTGGVVFALQIRGPVAPRHYSSVLKIFRSPYDLNVMHLSEILCSIFLKHVNLNPGLALAPIPAQSWRALPWGLVTQKFGMDLSETMQKRVFLGMDAFSHREVKLMMLQLLAGLNYMHVNSLIHRDIKPGNILVGYNCFGNICLQICDFGSTLHFKMSKPKRETTTRSYRAPELCGIENSAVAIPVYDEKVDIFAAGCVLASIILNTNLFSSSDSVSQRKQIEIYDQFFNHSVSLETLLTAYPEEKAFIQRLVVLEAKITPELLLILKDMLSIDPSKRPSALELFNGIAAGDEILESLKATLISTKKCEKFEKIYHSVMNYASCARVAGVAGPEPLSVTDVFSNLSKKLGYQIKFKETLPPLPPCQSLEMIVPALPTYLAVFGLDASSSAGAGSSK